MPTAMTSVVAVRSSAAASPSQAKAKTLTARERALSAQTSAEERTLDVILLTL